MAKYIKYKNPADARLIASHMINMGFLPEILPSTGVVRTIVQPETEGNFLRLLDKLEKFL